MVIEPATSTFVLSGYTFEIYGSAANQQPAFNLSCAVQGSGKRGDAVRCVGQLIGGIPYTLLERRAKGKGFTTVDQPNIALPANASTVWEGTAVAATEVKFKVRYSWNGQDKTTTASARFDPQTRGWPAMQLTAVPTHRVAVYPPILLEYPSNGTLGFFWFEDPSPGDTPVDQAQSGPNAGLWFLRDSVATPQAIYAYTHPGLYASASGGRPWYADQNGSGTGTCTQSVLPQLAGLAEVHEGVTQAGNSHYGVTNGVFAKEALADQFERLYTARSEAELRTLAARLYERFRNGPYDREQANFDRKDRPRIFGALGCTLDFNPQNP